MEHSAGNLSQLNPYVSPSTALSQPVQPHPGGYYGTRGLQLAMLLSWLCKCARNQMTWVLSPVGCMPNGALESLGYLKLQNKA